LRDIHKAAYRTQVRQRAFELISKRK